VSSSTNDVQAVASVDEFLNVAGTETAPLLERLEFDFLLEYDVFAPVQYIGQVLIRIIATLFGTACDDRSVRGSCGGH
jgi:hypothetical protein